MELTFIFVCVAVLFVRKMHLASEKKKAFTTSFMGGRAESSGWPFTPLPID
jgi:hypothetical protein